MTLPEIDLAHQSLVHHINDSEILQRGVALFLRNGFLIIRNAYEKEFIQQGFADYTEVYKEYFHDKVYSDALRVGDKRTMISVHLKGIFNSSAFYANPKILPIMQFLLGDDFILNSLGSVVSLPGSQDQHVHRDHPNIYITESGYLSEPSWIRHAPPYAITMSIPLVDLTEETGHTRLWPGTHLANVQAENLPANSGVDFTAEIGTCIIFDYRILHGGVANRSDKIRPLLYNVYSRSWFRDSRNYRKQTPLLVTEEQIRGVPKNLRRLFDWVLSAEKRHQLDD